SIVVSGTTVASFEALATPLTDAPTAIAVSSSSTETRFATLEGGVVAVGGAATGVTGDTLTLPAGDGGHLLGAWLWEDTAVSEADLLSTLALAVPYLNGELETDVEASSGWGVAGQAEVISVEDLPE